MCDIAIQVQTPDPNPDKKRRTSNPIHRWWSWTRQRATLFI